MTDASMSPAGAAVVNWLVEGAPGPDDAAGVFGGLCERLAKAGVRLCRAGVFIRTLHPQFMGMRFLWNAGTGVEVGRAPHERLSDPIFLDSPIAIVFNGGEAMRRRLCDPDCPDDFPILAELRGEGITDYLVHPLPFRSGELHVVTWATDRPDGFSDQDLAVLKAVQPPLARLAEIFAVRARMATVLATYVGTRTGERILAGQIRRGDHETIEAAIWLSDLRGFTRLSNERPAGEVIAMLNAYYDCLVPVITEAGGEVLKYIGDGLLALFPVQNGSSTDEVCAAALAAAHDAAGRIRAVNRADSREWQSPLRLGVALHLGEVYYGNIGSGDRLDFTAIGPAINLTARLEKLGGELGQAVVVSKDFATRCRGRFEPLGSFALRGFSKPQEVLAASETEADTASALP